jgi:iron complex transport system ATP-binding protein
MRDGAIIADGTPEAVLTEDNLEAIFGYRMQIAHLAGKPLVLHHL